MKPPSGEYLPWSRLMEMALGMLGIAPDIFWQMTPTEWLAAFNGWKRNYGTADETFTITRGELQELMMRFPD